MADSATPPALPVESPPAGPLTRLAWGLLGLTAAFACYMGLSALLLPLLGDPGYTSGVDPRSELVGGIAQLTFAVLLVLRIRQRDMGWAARTASLIVVSYCGHPLAAFTSSQDSNLLMAAYLAALAIAFAGFALARRHPLAASLIATLPTAAGALGVVAFAAVIAVNGF